MCKKWTFALIVFVLFAQTAIAQITVKGTVTSSEDGLGLPGVNVVEKANPTNGIATDLDGKYSLEVASAESILVFSSIGMQTIELSAEKAGDLVMKPDDLMLDEVVVTALGIKREKKALSYNVQEIGGDALTTVKDANFVNSLSGKVAGVTINKSSAGVGGATRVVMRGTKSIEGSNNALYVIDGVPLYSNTYGQGEDRFQSSGSTEGIADINPDDIESMSVLTGAAAAALYGSAAANGAIVITTKKGKEGKLKVAFSSNLELMNPFILPDFQNKYGNDGKVQSWGAKMKNSPNYSPKDFFDTAYAFTNSIAFSGGSAKNQTYVSAASTDSEGLIPNNKYQRYNFNIRNTTSLLNDKLQIDASVGYIIQKHRNMVNQGEYMNPLVSAYLLPRGDGLDATKVFEKYNPSRRMYEQVWGDFAGQDGLFSGSYSGDYTMQNPYWIAYRNLREVKRERNIISLGTSYLLKEWSDTEKLSVSARVRTDRTEYKEEDKRYASTLSTLNVSKNGYFGLKDGMDRQTYADFLVNLNRNFSWNELGDFSLVLNVGASIQDSKSDMFSYAGPLRKNGIPNLFNVLNVDQEAKKTEPAQSGWEEQTQSIFGSAEIGYNNYLFLTLTGRNDWASQLANSPKSSFFYPSVGLSSVITELISEDFRYKIRPVLSYMKARFAFSSVGSPFPRGLTTPTYAFNQDTKSWETVSYYPVGKLYPERTNSYEAGIATKWLNGKLSFDFTYYLTNTKNQTIKSEMSPSSGYDAIFLQTGKVQNQGIEMALGYKLNIQDKYSWNTSFTMSYNKNEIKSLLDDYINPVTGAHESKEYLIENSLGPLNYVLKEGGSLGDIYTNADFRRDNNGNLFVDENGKVSSENLADGDMQKLGSVLPDYNLGWRNDFSVERFKFGFLLSGRIGGVAVSMTEAAMDNYGVSAASATARDNGGVNINGYMLDAQNYFQVRGKNQLPQYYTYSATNFRLQEAYISYKQPLPMIGKNTSATFSIVGRNLAMLYCKAPFDPEVVSTTGNYTQGLDYFMMPSLRSIGFNLKVNF